jgi:hypothetical protein
MTTRLTSAGTMIMGIVRGQKLAPLLYIVSSVNSMLP